MFIIMVAGIAVAIRAGASLSVPAAYLVALLPFQRLSTSRYLSLLSLSIVIAIAVGIGYYVIAHRDSLSAILIACGLVLIAVGRLRGPGSQPS